MGFSMEDFRSRSCGEGRNQMEVYGTRTVPASGLQDLRCYSASYASAPQEQPPKELKFKKAKSGGYGGSSSSSSASSKGGWSFKDPELQRKKRVASYKVYAVEGKMKGTLRKSFKWLKDRCSQVVYGWS